MTAIPAELRALPQWVTWKSVQRLEKKKPDKLPVDPHNGRMASSTDPATWADYNTAFATLARYQINQSAALPCGVGFVFTLGDPYCGLDLDDCRDAQTGEIAEWAHAIIAALDSYTEVSPSGTGVKIFLRGKLPEGAKHKIEYHTGSVEAYDRARFFTVTGEHIPGTPTTTESRQVELTVVYAAVFGVALERQSGPAAGVVASLRIAPGSRTNHLVSLAGTMHKRGMDPAAIEAALCAENKAKCDPPLTEDKVCAIAHEIPARYPNAKGAQSSCQKGYALVSLRELMERPDAPVDYLLEDRLVAGTVSLVVAKPKVGKSTFARNLALAVSTGRPFLEYETRQGEVVYLALEERAEEVKADFAALGATGLEPIHVHAAQAPEDAMLALVQLVRERKPRLVVIDPLFRLARIRDEKAYAETYQALGPLIDVARESGTHIMLTHHAGKGFKADAIDAPLGSTALGGIVSALLLLKRAENYRTIQTVQRVGSELPETVLSFDAETRRLSLGGGKAETEQANAESRILEYLKNAGEPREQAQIREEVEGATKTIWAALTALVNAGKVSKTGEGKRGKPFLFSCFRHISGTREQEKPNNPEARASIDEKAVRKEKLDTIPVRDNLHSPEQNEKRSVVDANQPAPAIPNSGECGGLLDSENASGSNYLEVEI